MSIEIRATVGERGEIVIPEPIRETCGIEPGTTVTVDASDGRITIETASGAVDEFVSGVERRPEPDEIDWDEAYYGDEAYHGDEASGGRFD
jgi:AbrB family looped-hinge helix DNA binding protein